MNAVPSAEVSVRSLLDARPPLLDVGAGRGQLPLARQFDEAVQIRLALLLRSFVDGGEVEQQLAAPRETPPR